MDLGRQDDEAAALSDFRAMQSVDLGDYFSFAIDSVRAINLDDASAIRYRIIASLAGRVFEKVTVDVGFGDPPALAPEILTGPDLFGFAGLESPFIPVISLEQHVAEKVHAYTRVYAGGRQSTRVKDLVDLLLIGTHGVLGADRLSLALHTTFDARLASVLPHSFPHPPSTWEREYARLAGDLGLEDNVWIAHRLAASMLDPILRDATTAGATWDPQSWTWRSALVSDGS